MAIKIGQTAPDFKVNDQDGKLVSLKEYTGKKVVLYFYPKDQTPGCTAESCNLRDNYKLLQKRGYEVLGISTDSEKSHQKFIEKQKLPFRLLADTEKQVHNKYGTWVEKSMYGRNYMGTARITFIINEKGIVENIIGKVDTKNHAAQILGVLQGKSSKAVQPKKIKTTRKKVANKKIAQKISPPNKKSRKK